MQRLRKHRNVSMVLVPYIYSAAFKPAPKQKDENMDKVRA